MSHISPQYVDGLELRIAELEAELEADVDMLMGQVADALGLVSRLEDENKALRELVKELADDLEPRIDVERQDRETYPHIMAKWELDMEPVMRARALLEEQGE